MDKQDSGLIRYFTFIFVLAITCGFYEPSQTCLCKELNKVNHDSLPEKLQNYSPMGGSLSFNSTMTASGTAMASVSPSMEYFESDVS